MEKVKFSILKASLRHNLRFYCKNFRYLYL